MLLQLLHTLHLLLSISYTNQSIQIHTIGKLLAICLSKRKNWVFILESNESFWISINSFSYGVSDPHTGDNKHQEETLTNGVVHGSYSLTEPDGTIRKVTYTADKINGFNGTWNMNSWFLIGRYSRKPTIFEFCFISVQISLAVVEKSGLAHHAAPVAKVVAPVLAHAPLVAHAPVVAPAYHGYGGLGLYH